LTGTEPGFRPPGRPDRPAVSARRRRSVRRTLGRRYAPLASRRTHAEIRLAVPRAPASGRPTASAQQAPAQARDRHRSGRIDSGVDVRNTRPAAIPRYRPGRLAGRPTAPGESRGHARSHRRDRLRGIHRESQAASTCHRRHQAPAPANSGTRRTIPVACQQE
jgi:hypothetical protein